MSISIYYTARRDFPLSAQEQIAIQDICASYSIRAQVDRYSETHLGHNGEDFCVYDASAPNEPGIIFDGATKLPDNSEDAFWELIQRWCQLLRKVRIAVTGAEWHVHIDDHDIMWDEHFPLLVSVPSISQSEIEYSDQRVSGKHFEDDFHGSRLRAWHDDDSIRLALYSLPQQFRRSGQTLVGPVAGVGK
jgi:hypothetical protein